MVRSLPLRNGFFSTPHLTPSEETELLTWARSLVPQLHNPVAEWTTLQEKKGVQVCEDRQKRGLTYSIKSLTSIHASLDDVMDMFIATTTVEFRTLMQLQLRDFFYDSAVLYHKEQSDAENLSIKWFAVRNKKNAINPLVQNLDFCVLEYAGVVSSEVIGGLPDQSLGVCLYESIEQVECPPLWESHRLERGCISRCGYLFRPIQDGSALEVQFLCSIRQPPNARGKRRLNRSVLLNWAESVGVIEESISRRRISRDLALKRCPTWVSDKERHCCHLCLKTFTHTRRKHHCRACGEIICRNCSLYKTVDLQSVGLTTLRVCKSCMDGTRTEGSQIENSNDKNRPGSATHNSATLKGPDEEKLRDAVEEFALALPMQQISTIPDMVGVAWLRQIAHEDPSKKDLVEGLMQRIRLDDKNQPKGEQVDIYDTLCDLAAQALSCKYAVVSLIDENRQWFKSAVNVKESDVPRDFSFCEYPVRQQRPLVVMDTLRDSRFLKNPFVTGALAVRFLAGAPLFTVDRQCVGAVCVLDTEPRDVLQETQIATMENLAHLAMVMVQERREAQAKVVRGNQSLVPAIRPPPAPIQHQSPSYSSDLVPLSAYHEIVQSSNPMPAQPREDPVLKEQMIKLLQKASQVRDQVTQQSVQQAGLQSSGE